MKITDNHELTVPFLIGLGLLLSISTNLRMTSFPVGPGEFILALLAVWGWSGGVKASWRNPVIMFWLLAGTAMLIGALSTDRLNNLAKHHAMAYGYVAIVTSGICLLLRQLSDTALRKAIYWITILAAIALWFGFVVYLSGNAELADNLRIADYGDLRYSGWSSNPNQLALFLVPLPVWAAAIWRHLFRPTHLQMTGFGLLLFALMLMGLLVRSDGLFLVWVFEFVILIMLRLRWEKKASRMSLFGYALLMLLCAFLVKTFAHGEMRKSLHCAVETIAHGDDSWSSKCYDEQVFKGLEVFRIGYSNQAQKTDVRKELWVNGLQVWQTSPWFGHGPGEHSWFGTSSNELNYGLMESHNITIDLLTQGGILAGCAWLALASYLLTGAWRIRDSYTFSVVLMMVAFTVFHNTRQPYFWFVLAFSYEAIRRKLFVSSAISRTDA